MGTLNKEKLNEKVCMVITPAAIWWQLTQILLQSLLSEELTFFSLRQEQKFPTKLVAAVGYKEQ